MTAADMSDVIVAVGIAVAIAAFGITFIIDAWRGR